MRLNSSDMQASILVASRLRRRTGPVPVPVASLRTATAMQRAHAISVFAQSRRV